MAQITEKNGWLIDGNNNRASIEYFGSREKAIKALESLVNCSDCSDCSRCYGCYGCSDCSGCYGCSRCSDCSDCSRCSDKNGSKDAIKVPSVSKLHQKVNKAVQSEGALKMDDWHTCGTVHCRAGWMVHLAGDEGYALEEKTSTAFAAMQIAKASGMPISPVRFFDNNEDAMADIKAMAEKEAAE